jgi:hypothetical protein
MPFRGIVLIFLAAIIVAFAFKDRIYTWVKTNFNDDKESETKE